MIMSLIVVASLFLSKAKKIGEKESRYLSTLILFLVMPSMMLNAFNVDFDKSKSVQFICIVVLQIIVEIICIVISMITMRGKTALAKKRMGMDRMALVYSNLGFIGIPLINSVYGTDGVFLLMGCNIVFNVFLWTHGIYAVTGKITVRQIVTCPTIIAIVISIFLFIFPIRLPHILSRCVEMISALNTPLGMILLGVLFANFHFDKNGGAEHTGSGEGGESRRANRGIYMTILQIAKVVFFSLVVIPAVILLMLVLICRSGIDIPNFKMISIILLIASACPIGINVANFAVLYNPENESYSSMLVLTSTVLCLVTVPLFVRIAEAVL